jgi:preprotein translocase subunit YajC
MQSLVFLFLMLVILVSAFGFMAYRHEVEKRAREMKRNQYHDRV